MYITVYALSQSISSTVPDANHVHSGLCSLVVNIVNCSRLVHSGLCSLIVDIVNYSRLVHSGLRSLEVDIVNYSKPVQNANHVHYGLWSLAVDIVNCSRREPCTFRSMLSRSRHRQLFKTRTMYIPAYALSQSTSSTVQDANHVHSGLCSLAVDIVNCSRREPYTFWSTLSRSRHPLQAVTCLILQD